MSWFDTSKLANMANKAMKEAQKTLDTALDIKEEEGTEAGDKVTVWNSWKMIKSDSDSKLSEKSESSNASAWGSFSGSFFEAGTVGKDGGVPEPVSTQPVQSANEEVVTSAPSKIPIAPLELPGQYVAPSSSSVLGGEEGLTSSWEEEKFSSSRLVVTDGENSNCSNSPSVELVSPTDQPGLACNTTNFQEEMESVDQSSSCVSQSSIDVISPSSVELISPSDVEVISPEPFDDKEEEVLAPVVNVEESLDLDSSMSSDRTVVDCQEHNQEQEQASGGMQDLLEEAMVDSEKKSDTSSSRSSEIVKVESLPVSEVTSCDELEVGVDIDNCTTNSSDIEVISSPGCVGGKVSSTSEPSNKWGPHHVRNTSDLSTQGESSDSVEMEVLRKRNKELTDLLGARESRLVAVSREIAHLQEESGEMAMRLQGAIEQSKAEKIKAEERRKEVKGLENKVSIGQGEINRLEKEVSKLNRALKEVGGEDKEKDEIISDLRSEGEALARQNGKQAEVIRKLRAKEKGNDSEVNKLKSDLEKNVNEVERLRKSLAAKNDLEGNQSEAIKTLTDANQAWEAENKKVKNELEDNLEKVVGLRSSLESAYREMAEMKRKLEEAAGEAAAAALSKEVSMREEAVSRLEEERRGWHLHKGRLEGQVVNLQDSLQMQEQASAGREEMYRQEISSLRIRLEQSDNRHEDLAESVGQATKPLLRQIETLQASLREVTSVQERVEQNMAERLQVATHSLAQAQDRERSLQEQWRGASGKIVGLEGQLAREGEAKRMAESKVDELQEQIKLIEDNLRKKEKFHDEEKLILVEENGELKREKEFLSTSLNAEKNESENRRKKSLALMDQLKERDRRVKELQLEMENRLNTSKEDSMTSIQSSPTPSLSQLSIAGSESFSRDPWPEEVFSMPMYSAAPSLYESVKMGNTTALLENMQSQLKLKEGELAQLQAEYVNIERVKDSMGQELTKLTIKADQIDTLTTELARLKEEYQTLQQKYQTMLTMYGEKVEEAEELKLDLQDVKEMYKMQIDQLTNCKRD